MAGTTRTRLSAEDFRKADLGPGAFELVKGEVVAVTPGSYRHGKVCARIARLLGEHAERAGAGVVLSNDAGVITEHDPDTVRGADVCFYGPARLPEEEPEEGWPDVAPDLVVEVYSPSNRRSEILGKVDEYLNVGVLMVWVVHSKRRNVVIYRPDDPTPTILNEKDVLENLPELPGFRCPVASFFE